MWTVCITSISHVLKLNGYGGPQAKVNEKNQGFKGWETLVSKLQEVIELERHYKVRGRKAIVLMQSPNMDTPYFWIQVGFSTPYRFELIYNFYVSQKNDSVFFYDTMTDSIIRIEDWRKNVQKK